MHTPQPDAPAVRAHGIPRRRLPWRRILLRGLGALILAAGLAGALTLVWQLWWTDIRAADRAETMVAQLRTGFDASRPDAAAAPATSSPDGVIVHLPALGEVLPVLPGVGADVLDQGVLGHYPATAEAGEVGNFAVAGHRTTYGRPLWALADLTPGDEIIVETAETYFVYAVREHRVVVPSETGVLAPVPDRPGATATEASMVLTTCHPRFSARERLVAYAVLVRSVPRSQGPPAGVTVAAGSQSGDRGRVP